jgi:chromosome segregation ATPase
MTYATISRIAQMLIDSPDVPVAERDAQDFPNPDAVADGVGFALDLLTNARNDQRSAITALCAANECNDKLTEEVANLEHRLSLLNTAWTADCDEFRRVRAELNEASQRITQLESDVRAAKRKEAEWYDVSQRWQARYEGMREALGIVLAAKGGA